MANKIDAIALGRQNLITTSDLQGELVGSLPPIKQKKHTNSELLVIFIHLKYKGVAPCKNSY